MTAYKLRLNLNKMEGLLVGSSSVLRSGCTLMQAVVALTPKASVCTSFGILLDAGLLLDVQVIAIARSVYQQL